MTGKANGRKRLSDIVEDRLIEGVLSGRFPVGGALPLERDLAEELGVGRPTLREAIQRLERDGWFRVKKGQPTMVNDYWLTGNLNILGKLAEHQDHLPGDFVVHLLELRAAVAPAYVRQAVAHNPAQVVAAVVEAERLNEDAAEFAAFDWRLQKRLAELSPNPIYLLMLNSFDALYLRLAARYFRSKANRETSRRYYRRLLAAAMDSDPERAEAVVKETMIDSLATWRKVSAKAAGLNGGRTAEGIG